MLTRGADANHLYLQVVGDGDPHDLLQPENVRPPTATEILESILARDDAPVSATTTAREHASPTLRLGAATARYLDALHVAAEHHLGTTAIAHLEAGADRIVPGIADDPAWPTLRAHLVLLAATGTDPLTALHCRSRLARAGLGRRPRRRPRLAPARPRHGRHRTTPLAPRHPPANSATTRTGGAYLTARSDLVADLADEVRHRATSTQDTPPWWPPGRPLPTPDLLGDLAVWRAANAIPDSDHRPTGPAQPAKANAVWQHDLDTRLGNSNTATLADWTALVHTLGPRHPPRRLHPTARRAPRRTLRRRHRRPRPAPHHHRRTATGRPRRLRPLVAHPKPPTQPPAPRQGRPAGVAHRGLHHDPRSRRGPRHARRATPRRPPRTSPRPGPTRPTPRTGDIAMTTTPAPGTGHTGHAEQCRRRVTTKACQPASGNQEEVMTTKVRREFESLASAAERTGLSIRTLRRRIASGHLAAYRSGARVIRVDPDDVDRMMVRIPTAWN